MNRSVNFFIITCLFVLSISGVSQDLKNPFLSGANKTFTPMIVAHRGARAYSPENTMEAIQKAMDLGSHMAEIDVHISKDGIPVVVHDDDLLARSDVLTKFPNRESYWVYDFTVEELKTLDAGSWFMTEIDKAPQERRGHFALLSKAEEEKFISKKDRDHYQSGKVKIPTLREVLQLIKKKNFFLNIELKAIEQFYPKMADKVIAVVQEMKVGHLVVMSSFDHYQLFRCKELAPQIPTAILCVERIYDPASYCLKLVRADAYNPCISRGRDTLGFGSIRYRETGQLVLEPVQGVLQAGMGVNVWTENDPERMLILMKAGITGVITDYPNRGLEVLSQLKNEKKAAGQ